jgi:hypothetical protein
VSNPSHLVARPSGLFFRLAVSPPLCALLGCLEVVRKLRAVDGAKLDTSATFWPIVCFGCSPVEVVR